MLVPGSLRALPVESTNDLMLAEWPSTLEEKSINDAALACAQHAAHIKLTECSREELLLKFGAVVASHGMKFDKFTNMQLTPTVISHIQSLNECRGNKPLYSWAHIKDGYTGGFYKYKRGETSVMKSSEVKEYLAMVYCLLLEN